MNMEYHLFRDWPEDRADAYRIVDSLAPRILFRPLQAAPKLVAAVDTAYGIDGVVLYASAVVLSYPDCAEIERMFHQKEVTFPYSPGLLFFREGPLLVETLAKLTSDVDMIMVNGHGLAHPRGCGLACHIGYVFDRPTIGCARRLITGTHLPLGEARGSIQTIEMDGRAVGVAYRSKDGVKPIYLSPGHKCDLMSAQTIAVGCLREYRLPEPVRVAHLLANRYRQRAEHETTHHAQPENE
jgi:deoxyribonuclease V